MNDRFEYEARKHLERKWGKCSMDDFGILLFKIVILLGIVIVLALISASLAKENVNEKWYNQLEK